MSNSAGHERPRRGSLASGGGRRSRRRVVADDERGLDRLVQVAGLDDRGTVVARVVVLREQGLGPRPGQAVVDLEQPRVRGAAEEVDHAEHILGVGAPRIEGLGSPGLGLRRGPSRQDAALLP